MFAVIIKRRKIMEKRIARVLKGYIELSDNEKAELIRLFASLNSANFSERQTVTKSMNDSLNRIDMGPVGAGCPCCGR